MSREQIPGTTNGAASRKERSAEELRAWLVDQLAALLAVDAAAVDVDKPFTDYGLSSAEAVILAGDLGKWIGRSLPPTLAWDFPTIADLAEHIACMAPTNGSPPPGAA
ncbi:MAG: acyl carrier protein [Pirellulales bacterium]|nr:acyl carrier protein [Pirellulales bacterium]